MSTRSIIRGFYTPKVSIGAFTIGTYAILVILGIGFIFEYFVALPRFTFTDAELPAATIVSYNNLSPSLKAQSTYLWFDFWVLVSDTLRPFVYIIPVLVVFGGIRENIRYVAFFIITFIAWIVDCFKLAWHILAWIDCANFWYCRGRFEVYPGSASIEFLSVFFVNVAVIILVFVMFWLIVLMKRILKPGSPKDIDVETGEEVGHNVRGWNNMARVEKEIPMNIFSFVDVL